MLFELVEAVFVFRFAEGKEFLLFTFVDCEDPEKDGIIKQSGPLRPKPL